jgi:putative flippase GtrA
MRPPAALIRFLLSGAFNTAVTYVLYLALLQFLPYWVSYTLTFAFGIGLAYVLGRYFVFGRPRAGGRIYLFPVVYLFQYIAGLLIVYVWVDLLRWHPSLAPLGSMTITIPLTFVLTRWVFSASGEAPIKTGHPTNAGE